MTQCGICKKEIEGQIYYSMVHTCDCCYDCRVKKVNDSDTKNEDEPVLRADYDTLELVVARCPHKNCGYENEFSDHCEGEEEALGCIARKIPKTDIYRCKECGGKIRV